VTEDGEALRPFRIFETALYVQDPAASRAFYERVLGLGAVSSGERLVAMDAGGGTVLLLFRDGASAEGASFPGGWIPPHGARGPSHFALAIEEGTLEDWRRRLGEEGVEIESEVQWDRGGRSLYFRDPDGHSVELATPGVWSVY
jgi:catechol 2,3-dioxygenase-like lactoylglutathione lyase family enzyme